MTYMWASYGYPFIIAILTTVISVYINNSSSIFSVKKERIRKCLIDIDKIVNVDIYKVLKLLIRNKNNKAFVYSDVVNMQISLKNIYLRLYSSLIDLKMYIVLIKMDKKSRTLIWNLLVRINNCLVRLHDVLIFKKWPEIVYKLRHEPLNNKNNNKFVSVIINYVFDNSKSFFGSETMNDLLKSFKLFNKDLKNIKDILNSINKQTLIKFEVKRAYLGLSGLTEKEIKSDIIKAKELRNKEICLRNNINYDFITDNMF